MAIVQGVEAARQVDAPASWGVKDSVPACILHAAHAVAQQGLNRVFCLLQGFLQSKAPQWQRADRLPPVINLRQRKVVEHSAKLLESEYDAAAFPAAAE